MEKYSAWRARQSSGGAAAASLDVSACCCRRFRASLWYQRSSAGGTSTASSGSEKRRTTQSAEARTPTMARNMTIGLARFTTTCTVSFSGGQHGAGRKSPNSHGFVTSRMSTGALATAVRTWSVVGILSPMSATAARSSSLPFAMESVSCVAARAMSSWPWLSLCESCCTARCPFSTSSAASFDGSPAMSLVPTWRRRRRLGPTYPPLPRRGRSLLRVVTAGCTFVVRTTTCGAAAELKQTAHFARHWHAGLGRRRRLIEAHAEAGSSRSSAHRHLTS